MKNLVESMIGLVNEINSSHKNRRQILQEISVTASNIRQYQLKQRSECKVEISEMRSDIHNLIERYRLERKEKNRSDCVERKENNQNRITDTKPFMEYLKSKSKDRSCDMKSNMQNLQNSRTDIQTTLNELFNNVAEFKTQVRNELKEARNCLKANQNDSMADRNVVQKVWSEKTASSSDLVYEPQEFTQTVNQQQEGQAEKKKLMELDEDEVYAVITNHPQGIRLVEIGENLGVEWRSLIGVTRSLVDEGRVEKLENCYYPA